MKLILEHPKYPECFAASKTGAWRVHRSADRNAAGENLYTIEQWDGDTRKMRVQMQSAFLIPVMDKIQSLKGHPVDLVEHDGSKYIMLLDGRITGRGRGGQITDEQQRLIIDLFYSMDDNEGRYWRYEKVGARMGLSSATVAKYILKHENQLKQAA